MYTENRWLEEELVLMHLHFAHDIIANSWKQHISWMLETPKILVKHHIFPFCTPLRSRLTEKPHIGQWNWRKWYVGVKNGPGEFESSMQLLSGRGSNFI